MPRAGCARESFLERREDGLVTPDDIGAHRTRHGLQPMIAQRLLHRLDRWRKAVLAQWVDCDLRTGSMAPLLPVGRSSACGAAQHLLGNGKQIFLDELVREAGERALVDNPT
jgi:hypothetical protein